MEIFPPSTDQTVLAFDFGGDDRTPSLLIISLFNLDLLALVFNQLGVLGQAVPLSVS